MTAVVDVLCCNCLCCGKHTKYAAGSNTDCCITYYYKLSCLIVFIICVILSAIYFDQSPDDINSLLLLCIICSIFACCLICYFPIIITRQLIFGWQSMPSSHIESTNKNDQLLNHFNYATYDDILQKYVTANGKVKYKELMENKQDLQLFENWINVLSKYGPQSTPELFNTIDDKLKFYINAYNALTIYGVIYCSLHLNPTKHTDNDNVCTLIPSVMDINYVSSIITGAAFFYAQRFVLDGEQINLYHLENKIIRNTKKDHDKYPLFSDCRIHCAINCASYSCPKLQNYVIEISHLDRLCKEFVNDTEHVQVDDEKNVIKVSKIFEWYTKDFVMFYKEHKNEGDPNIDDNDKKAILLYFIDYYAEDDLQMKIKSMVHEPYSLELLEYNWALNTI